MSTSGGPNVVGINTAKITQMKTAISDWKKAIDDAKITATSKQVAAAIKGTTQQAQIKKLAQACDSYANTLTAVLKNYETRLDEVAAAYKANDQSSTAISDVTAAVKNLKS